MTERADYTDAEWATVVAAPVAIIAAVIGASPNGPVGISQEVGAAVEAFQKAATTRRDNPLIAALLVTLKGRFEAFTGKQPEDAAGAEIDIFALASDPAKALDACRAAGALLARKAPPPLAEELRAWLVELAHTVARAASEGGFFGIGGEQVTRKEQAIIAEIEQALAGSQTV